MPVVLGNLGALVDGQAGPCMGLCMGGAWRGAWVLVVLDDVVGGGFNPT